MIPRPIALGLVICERVIIEKGTENASLIGLYTRMHVAALPGFVPPFCVFSTLTGAAGCGSVDLNLVLLRTMEMVGSFRQVLEFPDRLKEVRVIYRLNKCELPEPGHYQAELLVDGEWIAQRRFEVVFRP